WVNACDHLGYPITAKSAQIKANAYRQQQGRSTQFSASENLDGSRCAFSSEAFVDAICEWIIGDSQSINTIESPRLRKIFLMLREELKDEDIPHRLHIRKRILEIWHRHLDDLAKELQVPGSHTGEHLANAFLHVIDRVSVTAKLGWITLDNAKNNDTCMTALSRLLRSRGIPFSALKNHIR
ncbi:hypothetical protein K435DRAFT_692069, partial [Dendrothele bispora CBS 962.96]